MSGGLTLRVAHLYPRLMNIYGDRGNIMCLRRRCQVRGIGFDLAELGIGERFEAKGQMSAYLARIPTAVIVHPTPAFLGLAHLANARSRELR